MTSEWDEPVEADEQEDGEDADVGFLGGGGMPRTMDGDDEAELDEHGDNLQRADEEQ